jgi:uncharacterized protein YndB with AHSA1/START domain
MQPIAVERSIWIDAPRERVWPFLTRADELEKWYATNFRWEIPSLGVGDTVRFHNDEHGALEATIDALEPPHRFVLRWHETPSTPTLITTFALTDENGGTRMTIHESGYEAVADNERQQWLDQTGAGYEGSVSNLKALVEGLPFPSGAPQR